MNESRSKTYKAPYESMYYKKLLESNEEDQNSEKIKADKMKQFSEHVKNNFAPNVDENKKKKID